MPIPCSLAVLEPVRHCLISRFSYGQDFETTHFTPAFFGLNQERYVFHSMFKTPALVTETTRKGLKLVLSTRDLSSTQCLQVDTEVIHMIKWTIFITIFWFTFCNVMSMQTAIASFPGSSHMRTKNQKERGAW